MSDLSDRVSYLRGLAEGLKVDDSSSEGKLINQLINLLSDVIAEVDDLRDEMEDMSDYIENIDEDLTDFMDDFDGDFEDEEDIDGDFDDDDDDDDYFFDMDDDDDAEICIVCECPECGEMFAVDQPLGDAMFVCPHCEKMVKPRPTADEQIPIARAFIDVNDIEDDDE